MAKKVGVTDSAAGAGVAEFLGLEAPHFDASTLVQGVDIMPAGEDFYMAAWGASITPLLISATAAYWDIACMQVPPGKVVVVDRCAITNMAANATVLRVGKRYVLAGNCAQAAPSAPVSPTITLTSFVGGAISGNYSYKISQVNALNQESALSSYTNVVNPSNQLVNIPIPALATGAVAVRIYRCLTGNSATGPWYWVDDSAGGVTYLDSMPDSELTGARGSVVHPGVTWGNAFTGDMATSPCEMVYTNIGVALASAPTQIAYTSSKGVRTTMPFAPAVTINTRVRIPPQNEGRSFATSGPTVAMLQNDQMSDFGAYAVKGFDKSYATIGGQWLIYGYSIQHTTPSETTAIIGRVESKVWKPAVFGPGETIVGQIGNQIVSAAGVRMVEIMGRMFDIPT